MEWFQEFRECRYTKDDVVCGKPFVGVKMSKYCPDHAALAKAEKHRLYLDRQKRARSAIRAIREGGVPLPTGKGR